MLELRAVSRVYRSGGFAVPALQDASLRVHDGDFMAITGPSGSGKSTLLQVVGCLDRPTGGRVLLDGRDLGELPDHERARLRLTTFGFAFQRFHVVSVLSPPRDRSGKGRRRTGAACGMPGAGRREH